VVCRPRVPQRPLWPSPNQIPSQKWLTRPAVPNTLAHNRRYKVAMRGDTCHMAAVHAHLDKWLKQVGSAMTTPSCRQTPQGRRPNERATENPNESALQSGNVSSPLQVEAESWPTKSKVWRVQEEPVSTRHPCSQEQYSNCVVPRLPLVVCGALLVAAPPLVRRSPSGWWPRLGGVPRLSTSPCRRPLRYVPSSLQDMCRPTLPISETSW
jgi:hypothetical protein